MKNRKRILAAVLTAIMTISMLPANTFATETVGNGEAESAVEAVSMSSEEHEVETTVEDVSEEKTDESSEVVQADEAADPAAVEEVETVSEEETEAAEEAEAVTETEAVTEAEETAEAASEPVTLKASTKEYTVKVTYDPATAGIPADAEVRVEEVLEKDKAYDTYVEQAADAIESDVDSVNYVKLLDISIVNAEGTPVEPSSPVDVQIRLKDVDEVQENTQVVHFGKESTDVIEPDVKGNEVSFETDGFSIYAVIGTGDYERLTVKFFGAKNESTGEYSLIDTMYVKKADQANADTIATIIHDPGAGVVPANYAFYGWSIDNKDYPAEAGVSIQAVRDYVQALNFSDGDVLEVYAVYVAHYTVKYISKEEVNLKSDTVLVTKAGDPADYTVNMSYPSDSEHNFEGWMPTDHFSNITDPAGATASTLFENGTPIKIKGDVTFSVSAPEGHWLVFHENGKNATFNAAQFVKAGDVTSAANLRPMERNGYQFDGWYLGAPSAEGGDPTGARFEFGQQIDETTDVYAKWNKNQTADYTVIIWKEGLEAGTYDYGEAVPIEDAPVDDPVAVSRTGSGDDAYAVINGVAYNGANKDEYKGFHLRAEDPIVPANTTVGPEGNTVVNVYYDRTEYTLKFVLSINIFGYNWDAITYDTITARYGTYIGDQFPIKGSLFVKWLDQQWLLPSRVRNALSEYLNSFHRWMPRNSQTLNKVTVFLDTMPYENITFYRDDEFTARLYLNYYGEALPGEPVNHSWDGKDWTLISENTARYNYFSEREDFVEIIGFEKYKTNPSFDSNGENHTTDSMDFYYTRKLAKITYLNGWAYDGNNARIEAIDGEIAQSADIPFGTNLSSYNKGEGNYFVPGPEKTPKGYVFEGWFVDKYCTKEFEFTTMPAGGITVYAKWREIQYRVFLRPNAGTDNTLTWGSDDQATNFRVSYGEKVSVPFGKRTTGYTFLGWFYDEAKTQPVYAANVVVDENNTIDYDKTKQVNFTDPSDKLGNANATSNADAGRWWIDKKLDLYAKWSKDPIGAEGISVVYNAGEDGTNAPSDTVLYQDNTTAVAGAAPTANDGKVFVKWVVQKWDKVEKKFVDTDVEKLPGEKFDVLIDNARIQDRDTEVDVDTAVSGGHYIYTIQVMAKYEDEEEKIPTHITWYKNDGSGESYRTDGTEEKPLKINEAVKIYGLGDEGIPTRPGYKFLGWAKDTERQDMDSVINTSTTKTKADFLEYKADGTFTHHDIVNGVDVEYANVTEVAADEITPYDGLYAIWEPTEYFIYHSIGGETKAYALPAAGTSDILTTKVTPGKLYGGYFKYIKEGDTVRYEAYTSAEYASLGTGLSFNPKAGETYYLKEVEPTYLKPAAYLVFNPFEDNEIQGLYGFTNLDSAADYNGKGLMIHAVQGEGLADQQKSIDTLTDGSIIVKRSDREEPEDTLTATNLFGMDKAYFGYVDLSEYIKGSAKINITAYYVTKDGIKVTGTRKRRIEFAASNDPEKAPVFTGWTSKGGNTRSAIINTQATYAYEGSDAADITHSAFVRTLMISAPAAKAEYTITKVYDSGTEEAIVEQGNYVGAVSYAAKKGYYFAGWYTDSAFTEPADFSDVSSDMTVYAKYVNAKDISAAFTRKSQKSGTTTFNTTVSVKGQVDLKDVAVTTKGSSASVLGNGSVTKTGSGKNVKYTTKYAGTAAVNGLSLIGSFTASVTWTTADGTVVTGPAFNCTYILGRVTVR